jgi:alkaline phosphatase D
VHFGYVKIDGTTGTMTVSHRDLSGAVLHQLELPPER